MKIASNISMIRASRLRLGDLVLLQDMGEYSMSIVETIKPPKEPVPTEKITNANRLTIKTQGKVFRVLPDQRVCIMGRTPPANKPVKRGTVKRKAA